MARPRSSGGNSAVTKAKLFAMISALPPACSARQKISWPDPWARPAANELSEYKMKPVRNNLPRPNRSDSLPHGKYSDAVIKA
jgi:hypothetical protein